MWIKNFLFSLLCLMAAISLLILINILLFWFDLFVWGILDQFQVFNFSLKIGIMLCTVGLCLFFLLYLFVPVSDFIYKNILGRIPHSGFTSFLIGLLAVVNMFFNLKWLYGYIGYYDRFVGWELLLLWGIILPLNAMLLPVTKIKEAYYAI